MAEQRQNLNEQLSSLMDGEASELEVIRLLKSTNSDNELRTTWMRYQLVSALIRKQDVQPVGDLALADRILASLHRVKHQESPVSNWGRSLVRVAVAASVALTVVTTVQWQQSRQAASQPTVAAVVTAPMQAVKPDPSPFNQQQQLTRVDVRVPSSLLASQTLTASQLKARQNEQFERYMQYHLERASMDAPRGMVPMAPMAVREGK